MKRLLLIALLLTGCSAYQPKRTQFIKNGTVVKTFVGRGVFDGSEGSGVYKIWAPQGWAYYEYKCQDCQIIEAPIAK